MREGSSLDRFKEGVSRDLQRAANKIGPVGPSVLQRLSNASKVGLTRLFVVLGALLLLFGFWKLPQWYAASWERLTDPKDIARLESDTRTTMVQAVAGLALLLGLYFTGKTLRTTQEGQITDRYTKAINQLGETGPEKLAIRLGGIYALERIARDSERDHWPIMEILTAYVREHAAWKEEEQRSQDGISSRETQPPQSHQSSPKPAADIQAILTVLGRRSLTFGREEEEHWLDLRGVDLRGSNLRFAHLDEADFTGAHLEGATLTSVRLHRAILLSTHLEGAELSSANLSVAMLFEAHLEGANLLGADLTRAVLMHAHLEKAMLGHAHMERAAFRDAHLDGAILMGTHLEGASSLTVEQLSTVETLYAAHLDPPLLEQIQRQYPHLLEGETEVFTHEAETGPEA